MLKNLSEQKGQHGLGQCLLSLLTAQIMDGQFAWQSSASAPRCS